MSRRPWSESELRILQARYPHEVTADIAADLNRSASSVYQMARGMGLRKTAQRLRENARPLVESGAGQRYKPGNTPWNKGKKGLRLGSPETQFKPGEISGAAAQNMLPIGTERVNKDGIIIRKVAEGMGRRRDWRPVHALIWEEHNGPIPDGHTVIFADGDRRNFSPGNLVCLSRAELMERNSRHNRYPPEINRLIQLRGVLNRKINQRAPS